MTDSSMQQGSAIGVFNNSTTAQQAIQQLEAAGFSAQEITIYAQDQQMSQNLADSTGAMSGNMGSSTDGGGFLEAVGDFFSGEDNSTGSSMLSFLGLSEQETSSYEQSLQQGNILVAVAGGSSRHSEALNILRGGSSSYNDVSTTTVDTLQSGSQMASSSQMVQASQSDTLLVPVVEESLNATKQQHEAGEVTIRKNVVEEQVNIPVELRHEEVTVTRTAVDRPVQAGDQVLQDGQTISVPLHEETVQVQKEARVTGEVEINKQVVAEQHTVSDTVRHEIVDIDTAGGVETSGTAGQAQTTKTKSSRSGKRRSKH